MNLWNQGYKMKESDLTVVTVAENDNGLINYMVDSIFAFTTPKPNVIICDNGRNGALLDVYKNNPDVTVVKNKTYGFLGGSNRHGEGLNLVLPLVETKRSAIIESDCVILKSGWDEMDSSKYKMSAAQKPTHDGSRHYYVCVMVFDTAKLKGIDWRPGRDGTRANNKSYTVEDCGWRLRERLNPNDVKLMGQIDTKTGNGQFLDGTFCSDEFTLNGDSIVAHYGRGSHVHNKTVRKGFPPHDVQLHLFKQRVDKLLDK